MAMEGVELEFSTDALHELAVQAIKKGTGARALRSLLERLMLDIMYEVPSSDDILHIHISQAVVTGQSKPLIRRKRAGPEPPIPRTPSALSLPSAPAGISSSLFYPENRSKLLIMRRKRGFHPQG
jgi:hypothetical protein